VPTPPLTDRVRSWYAGAARDLPWRRPGVSAWAVLVSEVMLQQTPVARVLPAYKAWLARWPTPAALAADSPGAAVRQWGRLGYPRRALALHSAATAITDRHGGEVPADLDALLALPGVGPYTARAVGAFGFRQRHPVVDTNVRRVVSRHQRGETGGGSAPTAGDRAAVAALLPPDGATAAEMSVGLMELGALVCTARQPRCDRCPIVDDCAWLAAGSPRTSTTRSQRYAGTDRQARGRLLAVLRDADGPVAASTLSAAWAEPEQRARALGGLLADGLATMREDGTYALPD
jgi:A/G-specific adenine glycosylase